MKQWALNVLIGVDQLGNAILGGSPDDTISSRCWKARVKGKRWGLIAVALIDGVFGRGHCENAVELDEAP